MNEPVRRIAVFGFESTGKTTLAERLAAHFAAPLVTEYARECWDVQGGLTLADMLPVAREQWRREDAAVAKHASSESSKPVICDTDALTTMLWSELLYGTCPAEIRREAEVRCKNYALYLLCDIDVPFVPDPQRCFSDPADRLKSAKRWEDALVSRGLPYVRLQGAGRAREAAAIEAVNRIRAG